MERSNRSERRNADTTITTVQEPDGRWLATVSSIALPPTVQTWETPSKIIATWSLRSVLIQNGVRIPSPCLTWATMIWLDRNFSKSSFGGLPFRRCEAPAHRAESARNLLNVLQSGRV